MTTHMEIKDLTVVFKSVVVKGLSIDIPKEQFVSIVGESGSGKSVTALSVCRLIRPSRIFGEINYDLNGKKINLLKLSESETRRIRGREIAYIFQDPGTSLNPILTIGTQLEEVPASGHLTAKEALSAVKIKDAERVYRSFPHELSGGMKQRVMIAMAILSNARFLIADEPTTALDPESEREIMALISEIRQTRKLTVLFITHNLSLAAKHSDRIYVMKEGVAVEKMEKEGGDFHPKEIYTRKLFAAHLDGLKPKTLVQIP